MRPFPRLGYPLALALARLRAQKQSSVLIGLGVAAGALALALVFGASVLTQERSVSRALARVPEADRAVHVAYSGIPVRGAEGATLDPTARRALDRVGLPEPVRVAQFKLLRVGGSFVNLAAIDDAERWIRLRSGRLPRTCTATRCEVVQLAGEGEVRPGPGIPLVRVGVGRLVSPVPFGRLQGAAGARIGESFGLPEDPPFVVAEGIEALTSLRPLQSIFRTYAWVVPLEPDSVPPWDIDRFSRAVRRASSELDAASIHFEVRAPTAELDAAGSSGRVAARRLLVVGGQVVALLLAFAVLAAASARGAVDSAWQRLRWRGARTWQLAALTGAEVSSMAAVGALVGWALGVGLTATAARAADADVGAVVSHSVLSGRGLVALAALTAAAAVVLLLALRAPAIGIGGRAVSLLDVAAIGAVFATALALARGSADADALARGDGTGALLLLLPALVTFAIAVAVARLVVPVLRLFARAVERASLPVRLAALSLARAPGRASIAVTFLVVATGLGLFASIYRSTLARGTEEQASYAFPTDLVLREDLRPGGLVSPLEAAPLPRYDRFSPGVRGIPIIRQQGSVISLGSSGRFTLLGVPRSDLERVDGWREDFASASLQEISRLLDPGRAIELRGLPVPAEAEALVVPATVKGGDVALAATILTPGGRFDTIDLGTVRTGGGRALLRAPLPASTRAGRVVALELSHPLVVEGHSEFTRLDGLVELGPLAAEREGRQTPLLSTYAGWVGANGAEALSTGSEARVRFLFGTQRAGLRFAPASPRATDAVPVVASKGLADAAGEGGILPLRLPGAELRARVVATAARFPTTSGDFVLVDRQVAFAALNAAKPGAAVANEIWLDAETERAATLAAAVTRRAPFDRLETRSRAVLERELRGDPLARGTTLTLAAAALIAAVLGLVGVLLLVLGDVRDDRRELFDLEAQGLGPDSLARHLRLRALLVCSVGLAGGALAAAFLAALVVDVVAVTASATAGQPPLRLALELGPVALILAAWGLLAGACVIAATRAPFRAPYAVAAGEGRT